MMLIRLLPLLASLSLAHASPEPVTFTAFGSRVYDMIIERPAAPEGAAQRNALVVLLGGGVANDMDWTTPAEYSMTGEAYADAPALSEMLTGMGFTVARYSTIHHDDPFKDQWPTRATPYTYPQSLDLAHAAVRAARDAASEAGARVILLGHSLGARRAIQIALHESGVAGVVALSPADLVDTGMKGEEGRALRADAGRVLADIDISGNDRVEPYELQAWAARPEDFARFPHDEDAFEALDIDRSGHIHRWELMAHLLHTERMREPLPTEMRKDRYGLPVPEDALATGKISALLLFGGIDTWGFQKPLLQDRLRETVQHDVTITILPGLGHNLSEQKEQRAGPVDARALEEVRVWFEARFAGK